MLIIILLSELTLERGRNVEFFTLLFPWVSLRKVWEWRDWVWVASTCQGFYFVMGKNGELVLAYRRCLGVLSCIWGASLLKTGFWREWYHCITSKNGNYLLWEQEGPQEVREVSGCRWHHVKERPVTFCPFRAAGKSEHLRITGS